MTLAPFRSGFLLVILFLGVFFGGCGVDSPRKKILKGDRTFTESSLAAHAAFEHHRIDEATSFYTLALKRARAMDRPDAIGNAAYNLAACLLILKQYDRAQTLLTEAGYELNRSDAPLADVLLLQARTAYQAGDALAAGRFVHQVQTHSRSKASAEHLAQAVMLEGQMACDRHDWSSATDLLRRARHYSVLGTDTLLQAQFASLTGRIAMGKNNFKAAAKAFEQQAELLRHAAQYRALSSALAQTGKAYVALNEYNLAADRLYRAARIAAAWGATASAKTLAQKALALANKAGNDTIARLAESLLSEDVSGIGAE